MIPRRGCGRMPALASKTKPSTRKSSRKPAARGQGKGTAAAAPPERQQTRASGERHQNEGHGRRLTAAFEALEAFPALAESRDRLLSVIAKDNVATADVV